MKVVVYEKGCQMVIELIVKYLNEIVTLILNLVKRR